MLNLDGIQPSAVFQDIMGKPTDGISCYEYHQFVTWKIEIVDYLLTLLVVLAESSFLPPYVAGCAEPCLGKIHTICGGLQY